MLKFLQQLGAFLGVLAQIIKRIESEKKREQIKKNPQQTEIAAQSEAHGDLSRHSGDPGVRTIHNKEPDPH